jgi:uridylate kinase
MTAYKETLVISVGGSLLVPERVDTAFLKQLKNMVSDLVEENYQIVLVIGGGKTSRYYHQAAQAFEHITHTDLDWLGIRTIALNVELVRRVFSDLDVYTEELSGPQDIEGMTSSIVVAGAWKPGHSSDFNAVRIAQVIGAQRIINFSNISHVYDADPDQHPNAQAFERMSWNDYRALIPKQWTPNLSTPFDPVASKEAQENGMTVVILGASIENLSAYLDGRDFEGTLIS